MLVVDDAMVLIHLAKITLLAKSCELFSQVLVPERVYEEAVVQGKKRNYADAFVIDEVIQTGKIKVRKAAQSKFVKRLEQLNIQGGEAEAVALYWQEQADLLACDDDNVRSKKGLLDLNMVGTPSIILALFEKKKITQEKASSALTELKKIGWFNPLLIDSMLQEVEK